MRDPDRIPKILNEIKEVWEMNPDLRLGQLIGKLGIEHIIYHIGDDQLVTYLKSFYNHESS